ncbi:MAG: ABC transporter ATP-binding protein [Rickettsiales bacterium]|nr:MAG: ABC transporter ATP-binding protein [Rickettsiales bacterium]
MSESAISIRNLVKSYDQNVTKAVDDLDLTIPKGSIFGLLGSNGAGKSTLINILAGTVVKNSGVVKVMGVDLDELPKKVSSLIGVVPQEIVFDSFFPIYQALEFTAGYYGIRPNFRKTEEILRALSLWDKRDVMPQKLSGGMKRRFLIAKAMVHSPEVLILDEPTAGVDIELRTQLWNYIKELNKNGVTIIITTHYLAEAQELCDEIAFIDKGKIVKQDSKQNLLEDLSDRHVDVEFSENVTLKELSLLSKIKPEMILNNKFRFHLTSYENNYSKLLTELSSLGKEIKDLEVSQPDLEDVFHQIVGR